MTNDQGALTESAATPVLSARGLAVEAGGARLLEGVNLDVRSKERVGLSGPSGCGKTTLLRAMAGLSDPAEGEILFRGRTPAALGWPTFRRRVVLVEQRPVMLDGSVRANLERPFQYGVARDGFSPDEARRLMERLRLEPERFEQDARSLSVGQQQRVSLIRALMVGPAALLLDEPTSALDADAAEAVETLLCEETEKNGLCAVIVTHNRVQAERLCGRILDLRHNRPGGGVDG